MSIVQELLELLDHEPFTAATLAEIDRRCSAYLDELAHDSHDHALFQTIALAAHLLAEKAAARRYEPSQLAFMRSKYQERLRNAIKSGDLGMLEPLIVAIQNSNGHA